MLVIYKTIYDAGNDNVRGGHFKSGDLELSGQVVTCSRVEEIARDALRAASDCAWIVPGTSDGE